MKKIIIAGACLLLLILLSIGVYFYLPKTIPKKTAPVFTLTPTPSTTNSPSLKPSLTTSIIPTSPMPQTKLEMILVPSGQKYMLTVKINDQKNVQFDGADLEFYYPNEIAITEIKDGNTFDYCPRKKISVNKAEISCLNKLENNQLGKNNSNLVIIYFQKNSNHNSQITVDKDFTSLFLSGKKIPLTIEPNPIIVK